MHTYIKTALIALLSASALFPSSCGRKQGRVWEALLPALPPRVSTELAGINVELYILMQTHEPLFRTGDGLNFRSSILRDWSRSLDSKQYRFCPDTSLLFDAAQEFSVDSLRTHIDSVTRRFDAAYSIRQDSSCVSLEFAKAQHGYFDFLSLYENAPTRKRDDARLESGLGPYKVTEFSATKVVLARKTPIRDGYNEIILRLYKGPDDPELSNRQIADFNRIPPGDLPEWVKTAYQDIGGSLPKSFNLIINHPDPRIRKAVYGCLDMDRLRRAYFPARTLFFDLKTLLPVGVPGAQPGTPTQICDKSALDRRDSTPPLVFVNWANDNEAALRRLMRDFSEKTGIAVEIRQSTLSDLASVIFKRPHPYNLVVIALDSVRPDAQSFLDYVITPVGLLDVDLPKASRLYPRMLAEKNPTRRQSLTVEIMQEITRQAVVLPLFQDARRFYYPVGIKNINTGDGFQGEYPNIGELRL